MNKVVDRYKVQALRGEKSQRTFHCSTKAEAKTLEWILRKGYPTCVITIQKIAIAVALLAVFSTTANSSMVVVDPSEIAEQLASEAKNLIQWTTTQLSTAATQVNTLRTQINSATSLINQGNPGSLSSIPGVSSVTGLVTSAGQLANSVNQMRALVNPYGRTPPRRILCDVTPPYKANL